MRIHPVGRGAPHAYSRGDTDHRVVPNAENDLHHLFEIHRDVELAGRSSTITREQSGTVFQLIRVLALALVIFCDGFRNSWKLIFGACVVDLGLRGRRFRKTHRDATHIETQWRPAAARDPALQDMAALPAGPRE